MTSIFNKLSAGILSLDKYGTPLNLYFKRHRLYRTKLGVFLTLTQYAIVAAYLAIQILSVHNREDVYVFSQDTFI
jgi:hypothetical protein